MTNHRQRTSAQPKHRLSLTRHLLLDKLDEALCEGNHPTVHVVISPLCTLVIVQQLYTLLLLNIQWCTISSCQIHIQQCTHSGLSNTLAMQYNLENIYDAKIISSVAHQNKRIWKCQFIRSKTHTTVVRLMYTKHAQAHAHSFTLPNTHTHTHTRMHTYMKHLPYANYHIPTPHSPCAMPTHPQGSYKS